MRIYIAAIAALLLTEPALAEGDLFSAIAYSPSSKAIGIAKDKTSREEAERTALASCGASSCKSTIYVRNGCAALAVAKDGAWGVDWGADQPEASQKAIAICDKYAKSSCSVRTTACVSGTELPQTADSKICRNEQSLPDERIQSCTAMRNAKDATPGTKRIALSNRAEAWESKGDKARAIADYTEALGLDPKNSSLYESRGILRLQQDDELCVADFDKAVQFDPKSASAYRNRGNAKIAYVSFEEAVPDLMKAIELDPKDALAYRILAHAKYQLASYNETSLDGALNAINKAIELAPGEAVNYERRGNIFLAMKDYDRALAAYEEAIRIDPKNADFYTSRGNAYIEMGDINKAISAYDQAITLAPNDPSAYDDRGNAYIAKGDNDRAIADYSEGIKRDPKKSYLYKNRALALTARGDADRAIADLTQANALKPKIADSALWLDIVAHRSNVSSKLPQAAEKLDMTAWPAPIIRLFLGQSTPAAVVAAVDSSDSGKKAKTCEANLYLGEFSLRNGRKDEAIQLFTQAANGCRHGFEWRAANSELRTLGVKTSFSIPSDIWGGVLVLTVMLGAPFLVIYLLRSKDERGGSATGPLKSVPDEPSLPETPPAVRENAEAAVQQPVGIGWNELKELQSKEQPASNNSDADDIRDGSAIEPLKTDPDEPGLPQTPPVVRENAEAPSPQRIGIGWNELKESQPKEQPASSNSDEDYIRRITDATL